MSGSPKLALPEYFALKSKSNGKYLRYDPKARGVLEFSGEEIVSPYVKFHAHAVPHKQGEGGSRTTMYHLRCCYNNKYWQRMSQTGSLIAGGADAPEEDTSKWACTLFKAEFDGKGIVRLMHGQSNSYLSRGSEADCLVARSGGGESFEVVDYSESVVVLPKHVAFKGDTGKYLKPANLTIYRSLPPSPFPGGNAYVRPRHVNAVAISVDTIEDPFVAHEVFINPLDATIRIKSIATGKFWRRDGVDGNWIRWDSSDTTFDDKDTVFQVFKVEDSANNVKIALKNCGGNGLFCKRFDDGTIHNCLCAKAEHMDDSCCPLVVEEPVKYRRIFDVDIRSDDARTTTVSTIKEPDRDIIANGTSTTRKVTRKFVLTETTAASWSSTTTWKIGGKLNLDFKLTTEFLHKYLGGAKLELSGEYSGGDMKGGSNTTTNTKEISEEYTVPPMKQVRFSVAERRTTHEIPFSYSYTDKLYNDEEAVTYRLEDGLFTSTTTKEVITPIEEPLPPM